MANKIPTRRLVEAMISEHAPAFAPVEGAKGWYWFRNSATNGRLLHQVIMFGHSAKYSIFSVSLYSGISPMWNRQYGSSHLLSASRRLETLSRLDQATSDFPYLAGEEGAALVLASIGRELETFAIPWFLEVENRAQNSRLVRSALDWLTRNWEQIPVNVADELDKAYRLCNGDRTRVEYQWLNDLKAELRQTGYLDKLSKDEREEVKPLADDILIYAQVKKRDDSALGL